MKTKHFTEISAETKTAVSRQLYKVCGGGGGGVPGRRGNPRRMFKPRSELRIKTSPELAQNLPASIAADMQGQCIARRQEATGAASMELLNAASEFQKHGHHFFKKARAGAEAGDLHALLREHFEMPPTAQLHPSAGPPWMVE